MRLPTTNRPHTMMMAVAQTNSSYSNRNNHNNYNLPLWATATLWNNHNNRKRKKDCCWRRCRLRKLSQSQRWKPAMTTTMVMVWLSRREVAAIIRIRIIRTMSVIKAKYLEGNLKCRASLSGSLSIRDDRQKVWITKSRLHCKIKWTKMRMRMTITGMTNSRCSSSQMMPTTTIAPIKKTRNSILLGQPPLRGISSPTWLSKPRSWPRNNSSRSGSMEKKVEIIIK